MELIFESLSSIAQWWWFIPIGCIIGIFVGAVPGFSATNTLIILLPMTLGMEPEPGLAFMSSVYCGAQLGGSVPAILFNVPGTGSSAVTCFDGYPMAQKGQRQEALVIAFVASCLGGTLTTIIAIVALPYLRWVVYSFGTVENFVIILFGVALIAQLSGKEKIKGFAAGLLGLLIGGIGYDHIYSVPRATFGFLELFDGVPRVPAIIGLFALSEAFIMIEKDTKISTAGLKMEHMLRGTLDGIKMTFKRWLAVIRSALIGFFIGIVPGAGATIGSFVSYQQAVTMASDKESFGKGNPEGIIAAEAANNGLCAGALIPLLTLGIPGGGTAAIMLIVMQAHGVPLGPRLFAQSPALAYCVFVTMLLANIGLIILGLPMIRAMSKTANISTKILVPTIITFTLVGAFVERGFAFDMCLALFFGVLGYIMKKTGYSVHAVLLGIILGPYAEQYFLRALQLGGGKMAYFFTRPVGNLLWVLLALSLIAPPILDRLKRNKKKNGAATESK